MNNGNEVRVSNGGSVVVDNGEEIRVSPGLDLDGKIGSSVTSWAGRDHHDDHVRVLDENGVNCGANDGLGDLEGDEGSSDAEDLEIEFRVPDEESSDAQNEGAAIGMVDNVITGNGNRVGGDTDSNFGDFGDEMDRGGDLWTSVSTRVVGSDLDVVARDGLLKIMGTSFEMGDMVWGKVKSHPWWPGHIFNEAFVSSVVRHSRKDRHVLVAFFGDSSYGYFDPRELIPYDPHYGEKSQQTTSKNFVRAVEDSVDEVSRRSALGLSCRCRNPYNFRPTHSPGFFSVDVFDYDPGAVYSVSQIQRARESFQPSQTLAFIRQLASAPRSGNSLDFIKQKATALAYRRSIFEEFDETYAQAFGQETVHPQSAQALIGKEPSRASLSGPLVIADSLGCQRSSKAAKPRDSSEKSRYLFKRRNEVGELKAAPVSQVHASSSSPSANEDETSDSAAAGYVLQKRDHGVLTNSDHGGASSMDQVATSARHIAIKDASPTGFGVSIDSDVFSTKLSLDATNGFLKSEPRAAMTTGVSVGLTKKKKKTVKRPAGERSSEKPDFSEKRMKKLKKTDGERSMEHPERLISGSGENMSKSAGRPTQITAVYGEDSQLNNRKKEVEVICSLPQPVGSASLEAIEEKKVDLPQMLKNLQDLALNPLHGAESKIPAISRQFFLKFRSLVYLKASSALSMAESEPGESRTIKSPDEPGEKSSSKPSKLSAKHEDSSKVGRKRLPSERQEEMAVKKAKKITEVKSLGAEKRALLKNSEMLSLAGKTKVSVSQQSSSKLLKPDLQTKKMDRPPRVEEPTYLLMKFQAGSSLPSLVELKARFARFGPLDTSLSRVFYTTNTCRVAFMYKQDAHVAYRYAVGSKSLFANVKFMLKPVSSPEPQHSSSSIKAEDLASDPTSNWGSSAGDPRPAAPVLSLMQQQQLKSCLKKPSAADEPVGSTNGNGTVRPSRVRFNMGEDKSIAGDKEVVSVQIESRNAVSSSEGQSCSLSSSVPMDIINNQRFMSSLSLQPSPLPHPPPQFPRPPLINPQHPNEIFSRTNHNNNLTGIAGPSSLASPVAGPQTQFQVRASVPPKPSIDILQQMMNLLTRCHNVVTNVRDILGYEPYHPL